MTVTYLNRLSDLLFTLGRVANARDGEPRSRRPTDLALLRFSRVSPAFLSDFSTYSLAKTDSEPTTMRSRQSDLDGPPQRIYQSHAKGQI